MIYPVITIRQPWAAFVVNGIKDIENRTWRLPDAYRNCTVLVHASAKPKFDGIDFDRELNSRGITGVCFKPWADLSQKAGHIIGAVRFKGVLADTLGDALPSPWADREATFWWMIEKATPLPPIPAKGRLNFWKFDYPHKITWPEVSI